LGDLDDAQFAGAAAGVRGFQYEAEEDDNSLNNIHDGACPLGGTRMLCEVVPRGAIEGSGVFLGDTAIDE
jgi:hypothetical protein